MASTVLGMYAEALNKRKRPKDMPELSPDGKSMPNPAALAMFGIKIEQ